MYELRVKDHFDAAHYIKDYQGKCSREHGHRWEVEVVLEGKELDKTNMLVDFSFIKESLKTLLDSHLDHYQLNEMLGESNVTAELLSKFILDYLTGRLTECRILGNTVELKEVTVWESPDCSITYKE